MSPALLLFACATPPASPPAEDCTFHSWYVDADGDGYGGAIETGCVRPTGTVTVGGDCDDGRADVHPGLLEQCNGFDDNCDGDTDGADADGQLALYRDADGDGVGTSAEVQTRCPVAGWVVEGCDCDDRDPTVIDDLAACRAPDCNAASGIYIYDDCHWSGRSAMEIEQYVEAGTNLSVNGDLVQVCQGDWDLLLTTEESNPIIRGVSAAESVVAGILHSGMNPVLLTVEDLALRGGELTGVVAYGAVTLRRVEIGPAETWNSYNGWVYAGESLELEDSFIHDLRWSKEVSTSVSCTVNGIFAYGRLILRRTLVSDVTFSCVGGGNSSYNRLSGALLWGAVGVEMEDSRVERIEGDVYSNGIGNQLSFFVVETLGDAALDGVVIDDVRFTNTADTCQSGTCLRDGVVQGVGAYVGIAMVDSVVSNFTVELAGSSDLYDDPYLDGLAATALSADVGLTCLSTSPGSAGVWGTSVPPESAAVRWQGSARTTLTSDGCDWGEGETENSPADFDVGFPWSAGNGASFSCSPVGCTDGAP